MGGRLTWMYFSCIAGVREFEVDQLRNLPSSVPDDLKEMTKSTQRPLVDPG
jgi:hypothetical protein